MDMSWEIIGEWILKASVVYGVYFISMFLMVGVSLAVYLILSCWHEKRGGEKDAE